MAKCLKHIKENIIIRVSNIDAETLTRRGDYEYTSKKAWKNSGRKKLVKLKAKR